MLTSRCDREPCAKCGQRDCVTNHNIGWNPPELTQTDDSIVVILYTSRLDNRLHDLLKSVLDQDPTSGSSDSLLSFDRPLGTFSSRIRLSYRLRLVDLETYRALDSIRSIRNGFAHTEESLSLAKPPFSDKLDHLIEKLLESGMYPEIGVKLKEFPAELKYKLSFWVVADYLLVALEAAFLHIPDLTPEWRVSLRSGK